MITITLVEWNSECVSSAYPTFVQLGPELCSSRKYPYSPHGRDWKFLGGGGGGVFSKAQIHVFTKCMKLDWNFQRGGGGGGGAWGSKEKSLPWGGGMDSFWNHTDPSMSIENYVGISTWLHVHLDFNSYAVGKGLTKTDIKKIYFQERVS